jgi:transposase
MAERYELQEWQWQLIRDLFPPPKATGRKRRDPRQMLDAIFWILCGGDPWRDLPERYGPWQSAYHWYRTWTNDGTFDRILERLQARLNAQGLLDLDTCIVDSTTVRASRAAAERKRGLRGSRPLPRRLLHEAAPGVRRPMQPLGGAPYAGTAAQEHRLHGTAGKRAGTHQRGRRQTTQPSEGSGSGSRL